MSYTRFLIDHDTVCLLLGKLSMVFMLCRCKHPFTSQRDSGKYFYCFENLIVYLKFILHSHFERNRNHSFEMTSSLLHRNSLIYLLNVSHFGGCSLLGGSNVNLVGLITNKLLVNQRKQPCTRANAGGFKE